MILKSFSSKGYRNSETNVKDWGVISKKWQHKSHFNLIFLNCGKHVGGFALTN